MEYLFFLLLGDLIISLGLYYLSAKSHIRDCQKKGTEPALRRLRIGFLIGWVLVHAFILWTGYLLVEWGGQN